MFVTTIAALARTGYVAVNQVLTQALPADKVIGNWLIGIIAVILIVSALFLAYDAYLAAQKRLAAGAEKPASE
jgi:hypothetical protein